MAVYFFFSLSGRGFTKFSRDEYLKLKREGRVVPDGSNAKVTK